MDVAVGVLVLMVAEAHAMPPQEVRQAEVVVVELNIVTPKQEQAGQAQTAQLEFIRGR